MGATDSSKSLEFDREVDRVCDEYERAWGLSSDPPEIETFLAGVPRDARARLLRELITIEIGRRRRLGHRVDRDQYRARFPNDIETVDAALVEHRRTDFSAETESRDGTSWGASDEDPNEPVPERIGRYLIERRLGSGGFGSVYLGHDVHLDRLVAIKVPRPKRFLNQSHFSKFLSEARNAARLNHPAIVTVYDVHSDDRQFYIVMEYIEGCDLRTVLRDGPLDLHQATRLVAEIAEAIHFAHQRGLIHRDLKPANVLIDAQGQPHVADFGLSVHESIQRHLKGQITGTPSYMSPEQVRGESHRLDGRCDIWSLGIMLHQLLVGYPPFAGSKQEIFEQILDRDPPPIRQLRPDAPVELERIILRCLSKRIADRYRTALELADELRSWLADPDAGPAEPGRLRAMVIPKGLRPFEPEDREFFLQLVAGPRDSQGLPEVVRFWKSRLDRTDPGETFAIGLICGPSGCGKSSLFRAGVLPRVAAHVDAVYVESTAGDTEVRLIKGLRRKFPKVPVDCSLPEILSGLREAAWRDPARKVVIVLDQFEQWLHGKGPIVGQQLVEALRQCDGGRLQCVVLVRDDFWMPVTRLLRELDVELLEGRNFGSIDLFDKSHARNVLAAFGRAYGALPELLSHDQQRFLDRAVDELAEDGTVISVRLALFADLVKDQPWTAAVLERLGGNEGVGVAFLERTFSGKAASSRYRGHQEAVRAVLKSLLPDPGVDIKGNMRSRSELIRAAQYEAQPEAFDELLRMLDAEVRLITPTDPEGLAVGGDVGSGERYYQLTHDYLVPAIRHWISARQRATRRGRAQLKLEERTRFWTRRREVKQLPTLMEWLGIVFWTRAGERTGSESALVRAASRYHLRNLGIGVVTAILLAAAVLLGVAQVNHGRRQAQAESRVDQLKFVETEHVLEAVDRLRPVAREARTALHEAFESAGADSRARLNTAIALAALYGEETDLLVERVTVAHPAEIDVIARALAERPEARRRWWVLARDDAVENRDRLRAAAALARTDPDHPQWDRLAGQVSDWLAFEDASQLAQWVALFRPVQASLIPPIEKMRSSHDESHRRLAVAALSDYQRQDVERLVDLLGEADAGHVATVASRLRELGDAPRPLLEARLAPRITGSPEDPENIAAVRRIRNVALAALQSGQDDLVWNALAGGGHDWPGYLVVHEIEQRGISPMELARWLRAETRPRVQFMLLLALARFDLAVLTDSQRATLDEILAGVDAGTTDPGVHVAVDWLVKSTARNTGTSARATRGNHWHQTAGGLTLVAIPIPTRPVWIGTTEVSWADFAAAGLEVPADADSRMPVTRVTFHRAMEFCNELSRREGVAADQWCYRPSGNPDRPWEPYPDFVQRTGFRLPTIAEWQFAGRAHTSATRYYGAAPELIQELSWVFESPLEVAHPVGLKPPSPFGLFDMLGNASEWCHNDESGASDNWFCGPNFGVRANLARVDYTSMYNGDSNWIGFRVVRTMEARSPP